jgi:AraC-like DNA-binding protein
MQVRARDAYVLKAVRFDSALLAVPLQGMKRLRTSSGWVEASVGSIFLVPSPCSADIENIPDRVRGPYLAVGITLERHVIAAARQLLRKAATDVRGTPMFIGLDDHLDDLTAWLNALQVNDLPRACHALVSIVLRLYAQGHHGLMYESPPTLGARIRAMVAAGPEREWSSADLEAQLGMSGASLRRHLAAEGMSLREIIADARLSHAVVLLTTTRLSVKVVAQKVGYASVSAFSRRFSERYGVDPSRVGT